MLTRNYPIKCVTRLLSWFRDVLCHVVMGQRPADVFSVIGERLVIVDIDVTKNEKISWREAMVIK